MRPCCPGATPASSGGSPASGPRPLAPPVSSPYRLLASLLGLFLSAYAFCLPASASREVLPNGLRVLIAPNPATDVFTATVLLAVPAAAEPADKQGVRYLTQRLLLRGTTRESGNDMGKKLAAVGGSVAVNVALDYTEITVQAPADGFDAAMALLAEAVQQPEFAREEVALEQARVVEAARATLADPFQRTYQALRDELYRGGAYGRWVFGDPRAIAGLSQEDVVAFYRAHYRPDVAVLAIAGGVEPAVAARAARDGFGAWRAGLPVGEPRAPIVEEPLTSSEITVRELPTHRAHLMLGFPAPAVGAPRYYAMQVIDSLLTGGNTARLPKALREEAGLVYDVSSFYPTLAGDSHFGIYAVTDEEQLSDVRKGILRELERLRDQPVPPAELLHAKRYLLGSFALSQQSSQAQAYAAAWYEVLGQGPGFGQEYAQQVMEVTAEEVQEAARAVIHHFILALTVPSE